ncbi:MAG: hypothetical protein HC808_10465 [Candidatus Competibacteraceae bacterium]|nr:hypothetical protein [Candidatus Competibacteraceae bacterium]
MKTQITLALVLASSVAISASATAEPFNNRGTNYIATAPQGSYTGSEPAIAATQAFNNRGENFVVTAPAGSMAPRLPVVVRSEGFNRRDPYIKGQSGVGNYASRWNR